jgi:hypothetical protein
METLSSCEVLVEKNGELRWQSCGSLQVPRSGARVVALGEKHLAAVGGCVDPFGQVQMQSSLELYDSETGNWSLLDAHLAAPRTCAVVAAYDRRHLIIAGGAGADSTPGGPSGYVELIDVPLPGTSKNVITVDAEEVPEKDSVIAKVEALELLENVQGVSDQLLGRVGCQGAVVNLPKERSGYPLSNQRCMVAIGGERCDRKSEGQMFGSIFNLETGSWCNPDILPPLISAPRTAVALCVGAGRVDGARRHA